MVLAALFLHIDIVLRLLEEGWLGRESPADSIVGFADGPIFKQEVVGHQRSHRSAVCETASHVKLNLKLAGLIASGLIDSGATDGAGALHVAGPHHVLLVLPLAPRLPVVRTGQPVVVAEDEAVILKTTRGVCKCERVNEVGKAVAAFRSTPAANVAGERGLLALQLPFCVELAMLVHGEERRDQGVRATMIQLMQPRFFVCVEARGKQWDVPATRREYQNVRKEWETWKGRVWTN